LGGRAAGEDVTDGSTSALQTNVDDFVGGQDAGVEGIMASFKEMTS